MTRGTYVYHRSVIGRTITDREFAYDVCDHCGEKAIQYIASHSLSWSRATHYLGTVADECLEIHGERFERSTRDFARVLSRLRREEDEESTRLADLRSRFE